MVIAGSRWQIPILKKIRAMGYSSLVVNLYHDSPAFAHADFSEVANILDYDLCLNSGVLGIDTCVDLIVSLAK